MPDISMCVNDKCRLSGLCYRFIAVPDEHWQSYSDFKPDTKTGKCYDFYNKQNVNDTVIKALEATQAESVVIPSDEKGFNNYLKELKGELPR